MIRRGQWLSFGRQFLERSSFRCIISPPLFSCFPPYSSPWFDQNLFKLAERERERGKKRKRRCSDGNTRVDPNPSGCIPYAAGLPVIHGGLVTLEFRWRISAGLSFARSSRVSCCRASKALRNAASDEIPCPSGAPWNSPSSTRRPLPSRRCWYSGLVRPNYSVLMRIAAVTRSGSDRGKMKRGLRYVSPRCLIYLSVFQVRLAIVSPWYSTRYLRLVLGYFSVGCVSLFYFIVFR